MRNQIRRPLRIAPLALRAIPLCLIALAMTLLSPKAALAGPIHDACVAACGAQYEDCIGGGSGWVGVGPIADCIPLYFQCMADCPDDPPPEGANPDGCPIADPVDGGTGLFTYEHTDLSMPDTIPIKLKRSYRQTATAADAFGVGMSHNYDITVVVDTGGQYSYADLVLPDAGRVHYIRISSGTSYVNAVFQHTSSSTIFYGSTITWNGSGWTLSLKDGTRMTFGNGSLLSSLQDRNGNLLTVTRDSSNNVSTITSPNGRWLYFTYDSSQRVSTVQDNIGRIVHYTYNAAGRLSTFTDANDGVTSYTYDSGGRLATITTPRGYARVTNQYDSNGRVIQQTHADGGIFSFAYTLDGNGKVTATDMTDPRGTVSHLTFGQTGCALSETGAVGRAEEQTITFSRDPATNLVQSETDALGRTTSYTYDSMGNVTGVTRLAGTQQAVTTSYTYDSTFNQIASITDPLNHSWSFSRDTHGNPTAITDPLGHQTAAAYNSAGQVVSLTDAAGDTIQFAYEGADLASITDPLGNITDRFSDSAGRLLMTTDPLGNTTAFDYDALDHMTAIFDAMGGTTAFAYDADGDLTSVTDANNHQTAYTYDSMDRRASRTDPLLHTENYTHDGNGNLTQFVDRRGVVTVYQYDGLNRKTFAGFGLNGGNYESTINYTWDGGNRLTSGVDSIAGTITRSYDGLDRLTSETTPQGSVAYAYDNAGRRTSMSVSGQSTTSYTWDNANRLTAITQGSSSVGFSYDNANRRTTLTLPNGVTVGYTYDVDGHATGMTYAMGSTQLGNLTYTYDADGRVVSKGGSFAQSNLPAAVTGNTFNAANEMTAFGGAALAYDANGNLTSDGSNTYSWNARNQLIGLTGANSATFAYDAFGRRASKTVNAVTTQFLYDRLNPVQELMGGVPSANLLTGRRVDEYFTRTDSAGAATLLADALGSTLALTDPSATIQTQYSYEPFGNVTITGAANANPYQYTGRENDGTGFYFYRARYYSPAFQRFISQDPISLRGGSNLYAYANEDPINLSDPFGLWSFTISWYQGIGGSFTVGQNPDGTGFFTFDLGVGAGGGVSFDPKGTSPGYQCGRRSPGIGLGAFSQVSGGAGPFNNGLGAQSGTNLTPDGAVPYYDWGFNRDFSPDGFYMHFEGSGGLRINVVF